MKYVQILAQNSNDYVNFDVDLYNQLKTCSLYKIKTNSKISIGDGSYLWRTFWLDAKKNTFYQIRKISLKNSVNKIHLSKKQVDAILKENAKEFAVVKDSKMSLALTTVLAYIVGGPKTFSDILADTPLPEKLKTKPKADTLYRGLTITETNVKKLRAGDSIKLKPKKFSSWTTQGGIAYRFGLLVAKNKTGIVVSMPTKKADVFLNIEYVNSLGFNLTQENEILLVGNGLESISKKDIVEASSIGLTM